MSSRFIFEIDLLLRLKCYKRNTENPIILPKNIYRMVGLKHTLLYLQELAKSIFSNLAKKQILFINYIMKKLLKDNFLRVATLFRAVP